MLPDIRIRQRDSLLEIAQALTEELDLNRLLAKILRFAVEMLAGQAGFIALKSPGEGWQVRTSIGLPEPLLRYLSTYLEQIPDMQDAGQSELPIITSLVERLGEISSLGLVNGVGLPLVVRNRVIGVILVFRSYNAGFSANDRRLLTSFANQAGIAVQNASLYAELNAEAERLSAILNGAADGMLILKPSLVIEQVNPAFLRLTSAKEVDVLGKPHGEIIRWNEAPRGKTLEQAVADGWPLTPHAQLYVEGDLVRPDLPPLAVGIVYSPVQSDGHLVNVLATLRDITHFREAEDLKSTFVSVISHELKTPVSIIKGYVDTLQREDVQWDASFLKESLQTVEEEADRLNELIDNLLDVSRMEAGGFSLQFTDVSLSDLATRVAHKMQSQTTHHNLVVDFPQDFPVVMADDRRIEQVLTNLISNAIKYAPGGEVHISGSSHGEFVVICVSDQGPGIPPQDIPHIFDRFYRSSATARQAKGVGLGLYLARSIVEAHGGQIWADSEQGNGARICFSLPVNGPSRSLAPAAR